MRLACVYRPVVPVQIAYESVRRLPVAEAHSQADSNGTGHMTVSACSLLYRARVPARCAPAPLARMRPWMDERSMRSMHAAYMRGVLRASAVYAYSLMCCWGEGRGGG